MANDSSYSRPGGGAAATPPPSVGSNGRVSVQGQTSSRGTTSASYDLADWRFYANKSGHVTSPPNYPDVSFGAYLRAGGNALGIGYASWKDSRLAAYNTAYNMYQQWYDSTKQQVSRIVDAGLNANLAYGMASPGSSPGGALAQSSGPSPEQVFFGGISAITGLAGGLKSIAEAATIVNELPESKLKGNIARMIDASAKAGAINAENTYLGSLFGARNSLGVGASKAQQEKSESAFHVAHADAEKNLIDYLTTHNAEGQDSDFNSSLYARAGIASKQDIALSYTKHKQEWDNLLSKPEYYKGLLDKAVAEGVISSGQAYVTNTILHDSKMDNFSKMLALQPGLVGFLAKAVFGVSSNVVSSSVVSEASKPFTDVFHGPFYRDENGKLKIKWAGRGGLFFNY